MANYQHNGHTVSSLTCHLVWATRYRYEVLQGDIQKRCRELLIQICNSEDVHILKGVVSKDHVHMHIEYSPHQSISLLVKKLKGRTSHHLQQEFPNLRKRYWGQHFWSIGYGVWSTGVVSDKMVQDYLEHHRDIPNADDDTWVLGQMKISFSCAIP